ncbi:hypothetical protein BDN72DRAFT_960705 [Pluteus cervinus]|uniref:Uncharacterized protein n=1 Tax=Pluteus cervinus TaxID=181527 RepID=A0ACD3AQQ3_9AGAR|nr:hypothetical protein BDN72DRAFT_960705 [Pluteus cervinus]
MTVATIAPAFDIMNHPARAILIGIDQYSDPFPCLTSAVRDATAMESCLKSLGMTGGITILTDHQATKGNITNAILALERDTSLNRGDPIFIFFSGFAVRAAAQGSSVTHGNIYRTWFSKSKEKDSVMTGAICPVDVLEEGGISSEELLQLFTRVVSICGNNITLFMDCTGELFPWGCPTACTILAPDRSHETAVGGAFTQAVIEALTSRKSSLNKTTLWSLMGSIQSAIDSTTVRCWGKNVNRPLFNPRGEHGHHAFIPCHISGAGTIILGAGAAHGVRPGAVYGAYLGNLASDMQRQVGLVVESLNDNHLTSVVRRIGEVVLPPFFFAVEERGYTDPVGIFFEEEGGRPVVEPLATAWKAALKSEALITIKKSAVDKVAFIWNGTGKIRRQRAAGDTICEASDTGSIRRVIRRAARFNSIVFAPCFSDSAIASQLKVQLFELEGGGTKNVLQTDDFGASSDKQEILQCGQGDRLGPYYITLTNDNDFPLWPFIIFCDPVDLEIRPWYAPSLGSYAPPLKANSKLEVGRDDGQFCIYSDWNPDRNLDFLYIKIFVTREKTDFSFFSQWVNSATEDSLRAFRENEPLSGSTLVEAGTSSPAEEEASPACDPRRQLPWASRLITLVPQYVIKRQRLRHNAVMKMLHRS